jgi:outer membrane usher protein FimD/PapC
MGPAIEYNIFPYDESTRKSITFLYTVEVNYNNYELVTVTGATEETLGRHRLNISANVQQPWGQIFGSVSGTQYLHDAATHRIDTFLGASFRIFRGFEFNVNGSFSRIKDQFFLPAEGQTPEDILLRRRQRETEFRYRLSLGFSYRFGSKFANIVNPRMGGGGFFF